MESFDADTNGKDAIQALGRFADGKTFLITGTSKSGIGAETAITLASAKPKQIILASHNESKVTPVIEEIKKINPDVSVAFVHLDLLDNTSVREGVKHIGTVTSRIDALINNAGIMGPKGYSTSKDGIESQFATCHVGHFLLTNFLIKEGIAGGQGSVIVNLRSPGYRLGEVNFEDPNFDVSIMIHSEPHCRIEPETKRMILESQLFTNSKVDNEWFGEAYKLAIERNDGIPIPPPPIKTLTQGAARVLAVTLDPAIRNKAPAFFVENKEAEVKEYATNEVNAEKLWSLSETLNGNTSLHLILGNGKWKINLEDGVSVWGPELLDLVVDLGANFKVCDHTSEPPLFLFFRTVQVFGDAERRKATDFEKGEEETRRWCQKREQEKDRRGSAEGVKKKSIVWKPFDQHSVDWLAFNDVDERLFHLVTKDTSSEDRTRQLGRRVRGLVFLMSRDWDSIVEYALGNGPCQSSELG
ncbi:MAG: hypothetical protein M1821_004057 [Bathelium mastoideum]|nr:MAG: hypothetical protein M1821_004057 [Bathelium mastoideum]